MKVNEFMRISGELRVTHIPADLLRDDKPLAPDIIDLLVANGRVKMHRYSNVIVDQGLTAVSRMIGHGLGFPAVGAYGVSSVADLRVTTMHLGTTLNPPAPATTDTAISENPPSYIIGSVTAFYPSATSVTLAGVLPQAASSLNGFAFTEEGLLLANGALIAHVTFAPEVKIPSHAIQFEHTITVSRP